MRLFFSFIMSMFISVSIFYGMQEMISSNKNFKDKKEEPIVLNYLREKKDSDANKKKRIKPKKQVEKIKPKKINIVKTKINNKITKKVKIKPIAMTRNIDISALSTNGAQIAVAPGLFNANDLETIRKVYPRYPRKAKLRKKSGHVKLQFDITREGKVVDVVVVESEPKGYFENTSIKTIKKWRFKPSTEAKTAVMTFSFRWDK